MTFSEYDAKMRKLQKLRMTGKISAVEIARFIANPMEYDKIIKEVQ